MSKTAKLLALAEAATDKSIISILSFRIVANPETIKQMCLREQKLVELVRLQNEALGVCQTMADHNNDGVSYDACDKAIEAFNKWENGE